MLASCASITLLSTAKAGFERKERLRPITSSVMGPAAQEYSGLALSLPPAASAFQNLTIRPIFRSEDEGKLGCTAPHKTKCSSCMAAMLDGVPGEKRLAGHVHDAEAVALGIGQDHIVCVWRPFAPMHLGGAQSNQTLDLSGLVVGVEVQVHTWWDMEF